MTYEPAALTDQVRKKTIELAKTDPHGARVYLREKLGLKKSQGNEWAKRILGDLPARVQSKAVNLSATIRGRSLRRLFFDLETSPNVVLSWRVGRKINIDYDNILKERAVLCAAWKWEGEKTVHHAQWDSEQDDKCVLEPLLEALNSADELVFHNGDRFDLPWVRTRCLFHGIKTMPAYRTVDTLKWARSKFYFNSNRLDYIAKFLGLGAKITTGFGLWKQVVLDKCPEAMRKMVKYCCHDVELLEQVWEKLSQVVPHKTHAGVLAGSDKWSCPFDGSVNVEVSKTRVTAAGTIQYQMRCGDCGRYYTISERAHKDYLEWKKDQKN